MNSFLCIGDPHFKVENMTEVDEFISKLLPVIKIKSPKYIVVLGDLLHTHERLHTIALNKAYEFIKSLKQLCEKVFVLVGNHDYIQNQQFLTENHWMNGMKEWADVYIIDKVLFLENENEKFLFCPYVPPGKFEEALQTISFDYRKANAIFAHQEFFGCKMGAIVSVDGDKWDESFPLVISGHIHSKQKPQHNIYYTGSAMQHAFGESEENIIAIFSFEKTNYSVEEIDLGLKRKKILYLDMDSVVEFKKDEKEENDLKITIKGNQDEFKAFKKSAKYKELTEEGIKVVFKIDKKEEIRKEELRTNISEKDSFTEILKNISYAKEDKEIIKIFELLVNNNEILIL